MPFAVGGRAFRAQAFNYTKVCYELVGLLWLIVGLTTIFWLMSESSVLAWVFCISGAVVILLLLNYALTNGWQRLSSELRAELPYDETEARAQKGSIRSYSDLWRWWKQHRNSRS